MGLYRDPELYCRNVYGNRLDPNEILRIESVSSQIDPGRKGTSTGQEKSGKRSVGCEVLKTGDESKSGECVFGSSEYRQSS